MRYVLGIITKSYVLLLIPFLFAGTILCAQIGLDAAIHKTARLQSEFISAIWSELPLHAGSVAPFFVPLLVYFKNRNRSLLIAQSVLFTLAVVTALKMITSRVDPENSSVTDIYLRSNAFEFGFLENGLISVVEGWPSGHAATNTAMAIAAVVGASPILRLAGGFWVIWVIMATIFGDRGGVHWFSDSMAGVAIGAAIAYAHISLYAKPNPYEPSRD
ncbi:phosphatase PAP2 family protein [Marinobacter shengliensis]|uniref:phosphatase PAP2 family protein n=1 Tax=Marinobacter shengliensis TaxID=1389223 RepID=UPI001107DEB1|nr:phosphatase PAP2 family protein [Marinobacter shengliensis]